MARCLVEGKLLSIEHEHKLLEDRKSTTPDKRVDLQGCPCRPVASQHVTALKRVQLCPALRPRYVHSPLLERSPQIIY